MYVCREGSFWAPERHRRRSEEQDDDWILVVSGNAHSFHTGARVSINDGRAYRRHGPPAAAPPTAAANLNIKIWCSAVGGDGSPEQEPAMTVRLIAASDSSE